MDETDTPAGGRNDGVIVRAVAEYTLGDGRTVDVRIVPYGERIKHNDGLGGVPKGVMYEEEWLPGVFSHQMNAAHRVVANVEHEKGIRGMVGRGTNLTETSHGFDGSFTMLETDAGNTALELLRAGTFDQVSLEAYPDKSRKVAGVIQRVKANLVAIAFTRFGAYEGARVLAFREEPIIFDEELLPVDMDPDLVERCRRAGIKLPQRYEAHPAETDTPPEGGTSEDGTRLADANTNSLEGK